MSTTTVLLPPEISLLVSERGQVWDRYDASQTSFRALQSLAKETSTSGDVDSVVALTAGENPPDEINAAISEINQQMGLSKTKKDKITQIVTEIEHIQSNLRTLYITMGVSIVILIAIVVFWLSRQM